MGVRLFYSKRLKRDVWGYEARIGGVRKRKIGFSSRPAAEVALAKARIRATEIAAGVIVEEEKRTVVTVRQVIERRCKQLPVGRDNRGYSSRNQAVRNLKRFLAWLDDPGMDVRELLTAHLAAYRDYELSRGSQPQTIVNLLVPVMSALSSAHENFPALTGWRAPARPKLTVPKGKKLSTYSPDVADQLLDYLRRPRDARHKRWKSGEQLHAYHARRDAADFLQMALQAGLRPPGEIVSLAWADVLWHALSIRVDNTKAGDEGTVFVPDSLIEMLRRRRDEQNPPSEWIFPSPLDPTKHRCFGYSVQIREAAKQLRIPWGYKTKGGVVVYTTRHTAATTMLDEGWDVATVQSQMRWSDRTMLLNYGHATVRSRRGAASALDKFAGTAPAEKVSKFSSAHTSKVTPLSRASRSTGRRGEKRRGRKLRKSGFPDNLARKK
jgi:integrase